MKQHLAVSLIFLAVASLFAQTGEYTVEQIAIFATNFQHNMSQATASAPTSVGEWSAPSNSIRARLVISETGNVAVVYLDFQNSSLIVSPRQVYYADFSWSDCKLRDSKGDTIPPLLRCTDCQIPSGSWLALPADSILRLRSNLLLGEPGYPSPGEFLICAGMDAWRIPQGVTNDYYLSGTLNLMVPKGETIPASSSEYARPIPWEGVLTLPAVKISVKNP